MSTTNKAFIKAYRHDAPTPEDAGAPPAPSTARQRPAATASAASVPQAAVRERREDYPPTPRTTASSGPKRPLSSYLPQAPPTEDARYDAVVESPAFRPGTTVASFQWPGVCRALLQQSGLQLDRVTRLLWSRASDGNSLVGVFSLFRRSGATTTALCLASRAANRDRRVILGDANLRHPQLAALLDAEPTSGWEDVLKHTAQLSDAVVHAENDRLDLLALGSRPVPDPMLRVGGLQAAVTAGILRHNYDLAILDLGTFFDPTSQPILLELVANMGLDAAIAVAGPKPADPRDLTTIHEYFGHTNCEFLGVIENRLTTPAAA